jgi:Ca2+-binding RTX toxin-like protein
MASLRAGAFPLNMSLNGIFFPWTTAQVIAAGPAQIRIFNPSFTSMQTYSGSFAFDPSGNLVDGTLTGVAEASIPGGQPVLTLTGASVPVPQYNAFLVANDFGGLQAFTFRGNDSLFGSAGDDVLIGYLGDDTLAGGAGSDTLRGEPGNDRLDGGAGVDVLAGGSGNDIYVVDSAADAVVELAGQGTDTVLSAVSLFLPAAVENLTLIGAAAIDGTGNSLDNRITGNGAANVIAGGAGNDVLVGAGGTDRVSYADAPAAVRANLSLTTAQDTLGAGTDTLSGFENLTGSAFDDILTGSASDNEIDGGPGNDVVDGGDGADRLSYALAAAAVTIDLRLTTQQDTIAAGRDTIMNVEKVAGSRFDDTLTGNVGANVLDGRLGADTMAGGPGDDTYFVDSAGDAVVEAPGAGQDTVHSTVDYVLGPNVENLALIGLQAIGTGNELDNTMGGNPADNTLDGGPGIDTVTYFFVQVAVQASLATRTAAGAGPGVGIDTLIGFENLTGSDFDDTLTGDASPNLLDGRPGADTLSGGGGNDSYVVDDPGDVVIELPDGGSDTVRSSITHALGVNVENLLLFGAGAVNGTGNALANRMQGNAAANVLNGGEGNDLLNGGGGADILLGGPGDDTYVVDNALDAVGDTGGVDTVQSSVTRGLGLGLERLVLLGSAAINGLGNTLDNVIVGNAANNVLNGGAGADTLHGGLGDDIFVVDNALDAISDTGGIDTVRSSVTRSLGGGLERLVLAGDIAIDGFGNALDNVIVGNGGNNLLGGGAGSDTLSGGLGDDVLVGGAGADRMSGGAGADLFDFNLVGEAAVGPGLRDVLTDFSAAQFDHIDLSGIDANASLPGNQAFAFIGADPFFAAGQVRFAAGLLQGNVGGSLAADLEIAVTGVAALTPSDLVL